MADSVERQAAVATRWSFITEICVKLVTPVVNVLLAHILLPSAFGVVASITMITSFAEMLQDAGFQKYIIQHDFQDDSERNRYANVAFWTNFVIASLFCLVILVFSERIAWLIGSSGHEKALMTASLVLPLSSLCSIQTALFQRSLDFKSLFIVRVAAAFIPLVVTLPLAVLGLGYWSLIAGTLSGKLFNAVVLTLRSEWKPNISYEFRLLRNMWSFSAWTLMESISIWLTSWVGIFIIGTCLDEHYVGLYNNSIAVVNSVVAIVSASTSTVLTSALSRLQSNRAEYDSCFLKYQRGVSLLVFLIGALFLTYGETITAILLGPNWSEAIVLISLWGFSSALVVPFANYSSIVYTSLGKPKVSFFVQTVYLLILSPVIYFGAMNGFMALSFAAAGCRLVFVCIHLMVMHFAVHMSVGRMVKNTARFFLVACILAVMIWSIRFFTGWHFWLDILTGVGFVAAYFYLFRSEPVVRKVRSRLFGFIAKQE